MNIEGFEHLLKGNKDLLNPLGDLNKASTELLLKITQQNMELIGENFSRASDQLKRLSAVKKPEDLLALEQECLKEDISALIETTQKVIHNSMENMETLTKLCTNVRDKAVAKTEHEVSKTVKHVKRVEKELEK